jgi:16S rRNA (adenine1518-N6/adenine1519-N6)-dimethyltransferase
MPSELVLDTDRLDQHLLRDTAVVGKLLETADVTAHDVIADLGAGTGVITQALASQPAARAPARTHAVEIDPRFGPYLAALAQRFARVDVLWGDILDIRLDDVTKVVANSPFRLTEHLPR